MTRDELLARLGVTRREFLRASALTLGAAALPSCGPGTPPPNPPAPDAGCEPSACIADSNTLIVPIADHPDLNQVGGWTVISDPSYTDPDCGQHLIILVQPTAGQFLVYSASCTHMCCQVAYVPTSQTFHCPCHLSNYKLDGGNLNGPAPLPLPALESCSDACNVYVKLG